MGGGGGGWGVGSLCWGVVIHFSYMITSIFDCLTLVYPSVHPFYHTYGWRGVIQANWPQKPLPLPETRSKECIPQHDMPNHNPPTV